LFDETLEHLATLIPPCVALRVAEALERRGSVAVSRVESLGSA